MLRLSLILVAIIISTNTIGLGADQKSDDDYWKETGLTFQYLTTYLQAGCYKSAKDYLACLQGINVVTAMLPKSSVFATNEEVKKNPSFFGAKIKTYGPFDLYEAQKQTEKLTPVSYWQQAKLFKTAQLEAANKIFRTPRAKTFRFEKILMELKPQVLQGELVDAEATIAAEVYNTVLASAVDPHTHIQPVVQFSDEMASPGASYAGVGLSLQKIGEKLSIVDLSYEGPAVQAGLKSHDVIDSVDGKKVSSVGFDIATRNMRGPEGTTVTLGILRKGAPLEVKVVRKTILQKKVEVRTVESTGVSYGYIKLADFMEEKGCQKVADAVGAFNFNGVRGIILDVRNNPGGLITQATCIASLFLGKQIIVKSVDLKTKDVTNYFGQNDQISYLPLAILMNAHSASASEILAGALQDYQRAWLVGERSYGKATVQAAAKWTDKILMDSTIARFYEPSGRTNQIVGIVPDFTVDPRPNATIEDKFVLREADYYTNALPPLGAPWVESRPAEVSKIGTCADSGKIADDIYQKESDGTYPPDYQLINSQVILGCDKTNIQTLSVK